MKAVSKTEGAETPGHMAKGVSRIRQTVHPRKERSGSLWNLSCPVSASDGGDVAVTDGIPTPSNPVGKPKTGKLVARHEAFKKAMAAAIVEGLSGNVIQIPSEPGQNIPRDRSRRAYRRKMEAPLDNSGLRKSTATDHLQDLLDAPGSGSMVKDWTLQNPIPDGLVPYDLESPSKLLVPRPTPLRNSIPRYAVRVPCVGTRSSADGRGRARVE